jgi:hypothetical protein
VLLTLFFLQGVVNMASQGKRSQSFAEASKILVAADTALFAAIKGGDKKAVRQAALDFAVAERDARGAQARENDASVLGVLK